MPKFDVEFKAKAQDQAMWLVSSALLLQPAYGRKYSSAKEAFKDFMEHKDFLNLSRFKTGGGNYANFKDIVNFTEYRTVYIRWTFDRRYKENIAIIKIKEIK